MTTHLRTIALSLALALGAGCISSDRQRADDTVGDADATPDTGGADTVAACVDAESCDDEDPCTVDSCGDDGACQHELVAGCQRCTEPTDCEGQGDDCEEPRCDSGFCTYDVTDGCRACEDEVICADGDACTVESCDGTCHYAALGCDDGDPCTTDACDPLTGCTHDDTCGAPVITLSDDPTLAEGDTLVRVGSFTGPPSETFTATVDWGEGAAPEELPLEADGTFALSHVYAADGEFTLTVRVVDAHARASSAELAVAVENVPPTVILDPLSPIEEGGVLSLSGGVFDPGDDVSGVTVDWGDGTDPEPVTLEPAGTFALSHRYDDDGTHALTVTATDDVEHGGAEVEVVVANAPPHFVPPSNRVVLEGTPTVMTLPISDPGAADAFSGEVRYGLGGPPEALVIDDHQIVLTLTYPDDGTWPVTITLRDEDGGESVDGFSIAVTNVAPEVLDPGDQQLVEGQPLDLDASFTDPGSDSWTAQASFGDGTPVGSPAIDAATRVIQLTHAWQDDGTFLAFVSVTDDDDGEDAATFTVAVSNAPPAANAGADASVDEGATFLRDAVATDPGLGDDLNGSVKWGDGEAEETLSIDVASRAYRLERSYPDEGIHHVAVTVRDDDGASATEHFTLTVVNVPPAIDCGSHAVLAAGGRLERTCTFVDPGADSWSGAVDWGDGSPPEPLALGDGAFEIGHTFGTEATYEVVVTLEDGTEPGVTTFDVAVGNAPPLVDAGPDATVDEGASFARQGHAYDASTGSFSATVDYGDGGGPDALPLTPALAFDLAHTYVEDGLYDLTVTVTDPDDTVGQDVVRVTVRNRAPGILAGGDVSLAEGARLERTISIVDPGPLDVVTATVDYGDGGGGEALALGPDGAAELSHAFTHDGDHTVKITASDDDGGVSHASFVVHVANGAPVVTVGGDGQSVEGDTFHREVTFADAGADDWVLRVGWGDGTPQVEVFGVAPSVAVPLSHVYTDDGDYTVSVMVGDGTAVTTETFVVEVANAAPVVSAGGDATLAEGGTFTRSGSVADPGVHDAVTATVDWGDGQGPKALALNAGGGFTLSRAFPKDGVHTVTVAASDGVDAGSASFVLTVQNVAPTVAVGQPITVAEGQAFTRDVTFTDPGADAWTATVDWDDGGSPAPVAVGPGKTVKLSRTYPDNAVHDVVVAVNDGVATGSAQLQVTVTNAPPTVDAGGDVGLSEGGKLSRSGTVSDPGASDTFTATVDYGEGGPKPLTIKPDRTFELSHTYAANGQYTVIVRVTDDDEGVGTDTFLVTVSNTAPVVTAGPDAQLDEGGLLSRVVTFSDSGADAWTATVDYGDGGGPIPVPVNAAAKTVTLAHTYLDDATYEVVVTLNDGVETGQGSFKAIVANVLPVVSGGAAATAAEGATWSRDGSFTDPGVLDPHTATVDWGDGGATVSLALTPQGTFALRHAFADDGSYNVTVTVHDDDGVGTAVIPVTVSNVAPNLPATLGPVTLAVGQRWQQLVTFTDPGADAWALSASYGDGPAQVTPLSSRSFEISHTYWTPGDVSASFTVSDGDGGSDIVSAVVHVLNVAPTVDATDPPQVAEGSAVVVTATFEDPGTESHTATVQWTPTVVRTATVDENAGVVSGSYTFADEGQHDVVVTVKDAYDATGSDTAHVVVINVAPVVDAGGDGATTSLGVLARQASFTDPGDDTWTVTVDWGDDSPPGHPEVAEGKRFALQHQYAVSGTFTVVVEVDDGDGGVGTATFDVTATVPDCSGVATTGKQWIGGAISNPTGWGEAANWKPAGAPAASDDVYLCAGSVYYPVLGQAAWVHDVHMAPSASIATGGRPLTVTGDLVGGAVTGTGMVTMSGVGVVLATDVPSLQVTGDVRAEAALTIGGALTISDGASFGPTDVTVSVRGALSVSSSASGTGLVLDSDSDVVAVTGKLTAWPGGANGQSPVSSMTAGLLRLFGDFQQKGGSHQPIAFLAAGTEVELVGTVDQQVQFEDPGPTRSRFGDLTLSGTHRVDLESDVAVTGRLSLTGTATLRSDDAVLLTSAMPHLGPGVDYDVTTTAIVGDVSLEDDFYLRGDKHALRVAGGGKLHVGPYTLDLDGDLTVLIEGSPTSGLHMGSSESEVAVGGLAEFQNLTSTGAQSQLQAGTLWLQGGLVVPGSGAAPAAFAPVGVTTHILGGGYSQPHDVSFAHTTKNRFGVLVLEPGVRMNLLSDVQADTLIVDAIDRAYVTGPHLLTAATLDAGGLTVEEALVSTSNLVRLTDATFREQDPTADQLTVLGQVLDLAVERLRFETVPTTGAYIYGVNGSPGAQKKPKLTVLDSVPLNGRPWCRVYDEFQILWGDPEDDSDADGLTDVKEHTLGADPLDPDSDGDTFLDGTEYGVGTSPTAAASVPFTLAAPASYDVGEGAWDLAVGDVDGDGALDLAVSNETTGEVAVWFAEKATPGVFTERVDVQLGEGAAPRGLTVATLRGTRYVLVTESASDELGLVTATGISGDTRALARVDALETCERPNDVITIESNLGLGPDVVVACSASDEVRVFNGTFDPTGGGWSWSHTDYPVGDGPVALAAGDVTSVVPFDVATANASGTVTLLRGGTYAVSATLDDAGAADVAIANLNAAGRSDLACARSTTDQVSVRFDEGSEAGLSGPQLYDVGATPLGITAGDLDGNGWLDLAIATSGDGALSLLLGGAPPATPYQLYPHDVPLPEEAAPRRVVLVDLDEDGLLDVVALAGEQGRVIVLRQAVVSETTSTP